jgi:hypothetical protein
MLLVGGDVILVMGMLLLILMCQLLGLLCFVLVGLFSLILFMSVVLGLQYERFMQNVGLYSNLGYALVFY